jgi:D-3-phosphoglycerate dehydrogenase
MNISLTLLSIHDKFRPMRITIFTPNAEFSQEHTLKLAKLGNVIYTDSRREYSLSELTKMSKGSDIIGFDPDNIGGFAVAKERLVKLADQLPSLKAIALASTSFGYIDQQYFKQRHIQITNVPSYSSESVAEHAVGMLLGCAKRLFLSDRSTQKGEYSLVMGQEIVGKTLGIIGLGSIGSRTAQLARSLGMNVIAYNRTPRQLDGVKLHSLNYVLRHSDFLSLHLRTTPDTMNFITKDRVQLLKHGVTIVNTANRHLVDEQAISSALKLGQVDSYALEAEDLKSGPLPKCPNAFLFKGFGWYTKEALERNKEIWVNNILGLAKGKPTNLVC